MNGEVKGVKNMYEIVEKDEYQPVRSQLEEIIHQVQEIVRREFTFQYQLIGSGSHHLITRIKGGNQGFDFDYNLILNGPGDGKIWNPEFARTTIFSALKKAIQNTPFDGPHNKTPAISIKVVDQNNSRIIHGCDFAVVYYPEEEESHYYKYARLNKATSTYTWEERKLCRDVDELKNWVVSNNHWNELREEYIDLKNKNTDPDKVSFSLYHEAVHNVYNWYNQDQDEDDDGWDD